MTEHRALIGVRRRRIAARRRVAAATAATRDAETRAAERWRAEYGVTFDALDAARSATPSRTRASALVALRYTPDSISDPNALRDRVCAPLRAASAAAS